MTPLRLPVRVDDEGLLAQEQYLEHGGLLVPIEGEPPAEMADVVVEIEAPAGRAEIAARVVSVMPGVGVGVAFEDPDDVKRQLAPLLESARRHGTGERPIPDASTEEQPTEEHPLAEHSTGEHATFEHGTNLQVRIQHMSTIEKQELAMTGDRVSRMLLMKDANKAIHLYVLRNRQLSPDEVRIMAAYRNINPDALQRIAQNQDWMRDLRIVAALVSNPKTPPQVALRLVDRLPAAEIRRLARSADAPRAVQRAARQKLHTM